MDGSSVVDAYPIGHWDLGESRWRAAVRVEHGI